MRRIVLASLLRVLDGEGSGSLSVIHDAAADSTLACWDVLRRRGGGRRDLAVGSGPADVDGGRGIAPRGPEADGARSGLYGAKIG